MENDIRVVAFLKVKPGAKPAMEAAVGACSSASRAEDGCVMYAGHWDQSDEHRLVFVEHWTSREALDRHMTTPHFHTFVAAIENLVQGPPEIIVLKEIR
ncbi:MAG: antibiotic biosynthesis monooxygenase [Proteobacteria bacterium]|nr:antibiotic biosynthesis monooxygenase [Pseudomonadota bacterium]